MTAREDLFRRVAGAFVDDARANALIDAAIAEALRETAQRIKALSDFEEGGYGDGLLSAYRLVMETAEEIS